MSRWPRRARRRAVRLRRAPRHRDRRTGTSQGSRHDGLASRPLVAVLSPWARPIDRARRRVGPLRAPRPRARRRRTVLGRWSRSWAASRSRSSCACPRAPSRGPARVEVRSRTASGACVELGVADLEMVGGDRGRRRRSVRRRASRVELCSVAIGSSSATTRSPSSSRERPLRGHAARGARPRAAARARPNGCGASFAPLYSLRTELGIGADVVDLDCSAAWIDGYGGRSSAPCPLLATYLDRALRAEPLRAVSAAGSGTSSTSTSSGCPSWPRSPAARPGSTTRHPGRDRRAATAGRFRRAGASAGW